MTLVERLSHARLKRAALVTGALLLGLIVAEGALRLAGHRPCRQRATQIGRSVTRRPAPGLPYLFEPGSSFTERWPSDPHGYLGADCAITYQVNNAGFRGRDFVREHPGVVRVAILGDSFAWGSGVGEKDLSSGHVERVLRSSDLSGGRFEVYNFGLAAYDTSQEVALLEHTVLGYEPDVCVLWFFLNDLGSPGSLAFLGGNDRWWGLRERSAVIDVLLKPLDEWVGRRDLAASYARDYAPDSALFKALRSNLGLFAALCRKHEILPVLAVHPMLTALHDDHPFADVHARVARLAEEQGIHAIDLLPAFLGREAEQLWVHPADQHPNHVAHRIAGESFGEALLEHLTESGLRSR